MSIQNSSKWLHYIDALFKESFIHYDSGRFIDINVRTFHIPKYPFENEYNLEISYLDSERLIVTCPLFNPNQLKVDIDCELKAIELSMYRVRVTIDGQWYRATN